MGAAGYRWEASRMLRVCGAGMLSHFTRGLPREVLTDDWLTAADNLNLETWLTLHEASPALAGPLAPAVLPGTTAADLARTLDLPHEFSGDALPFLALSADERQFAMWGLVLANLLCFLDDAGGSAHVLFAERLREAETSARPWATHLRSARQRVWDQTELISAEELSFATSLTNSAHQVELAGVPEPTWGDRGLNSVPLVEILELPSIPDIVEDPIRRLEAVARRRRHIKQSHAVFQLLQPTERARFLSRGGIGGRAFSMINDFTVQGLEAEKRRALGLDPSAVVTHHPPGEIYMDFNLWRLGVPKGPHLATLEDVHLPAQCPCCKTNLQESVMTPARRALWIQDHFARCPGKGGMVHLIHNGGRLALFAGVVTARDPAPVQRYQSEISVVELRNVRDDQSRPGDVAILGYTDPTSADSSGLLLDFTCVLPTCSTALARGSDVLPGAAAAAAESAKFHRDRVSVAPVRDLDFRLVPVAFESFGRPGAHTAAVFREFAARLVYEGRAGTLRQGPLSCPKGAAVRELQLLWYGRMIFQIAASHHEAWTKCWRLCRAGGSEPVATGLGSQPGG